MSLGNWQTLCEAREGSGLIFLIWLLFTFLVRFQFLIWLLFTFLVMFDLDNFTMFNLFRFGLYHSLFEWYHPLYLQDKADFAGWMIKLLESSFRRTTKLLATLLSRRWLQNWKSWSERECFLSESVKEEKSQQNYIEKHKSTGTNRKCSGLMGIGRQRRTIGTHLDSSGFPSHSLHLHCVPQIAYRTMPLFVFFFIKLNFSWLYNESPVKDTIVTNDR